MYVFFGKLYIQKCWPDKGFTLIPPELIWTFAEVPKEQPAFATFTSEPWPHGFMP